MADQPDNQEALTFEQALAALPVKRRRFVVEYLVDLRQRDAAIRAGYSAKSADAQASQILKNAKVLAAVEAGMNLHAMPTPEILHRLSRIARNSIADVLRLPTGDELLPAGGGWDIDLVKAQATGAIHLVKKIKEGEYGPEVELYSAHEALRDLAKIRGLTVDRSRQEPNGPPIEWERVSEEDQIAFLEGKLTLADVLKRLQSRG